MIFKSVKIVSLIFVYSIFIIACATSVKREPPISAVELARQELFNQTQPTNSSAGMAIAELPYTPTTLPKQVGQTGSLPIVETLNDDPTDDFDLSNIGDFEFNFEQIALTQLIEIIADALKISTVVDPSIGDKITIRTSSDKPLHRKDLWPLLQLLLTDAGITVEKKAGVYHFKKTGPEVPGVIGLPSGSLIDGEASEILQVTPLRFITVESATAVLNPLLQQQGRIISLPSLNIIGIITTPQRLERINKLLALVDADPFLHRGMRLFRLNNSKAVEVQADLDKILQALTGQTGSYQVIALERINAILAISPPDAGFDEVSTWISILDEKSEESGEQVFIYRVKNVEAKELASTLSSAFKSENPEDVINRNQEEGVIPDMSLDENGNIIIDQTDSSSDVRPRGAVSAALKVTIVADEGTNSLLIRASPRDYQQLLETIFQLDRVPKEVMIHAAVAEVTLTDTTKFGVDWEALFGSTRQVGDVQDRSSIATNFGIRGAEPTSGLVINHIAGGLTAILNLASSNNDVRILIRPSILVRNNQKARINVGGNEPYLSGINASTTNYNQTSRDVQYKETGIILEVTPRINDEGIVSMEILQELSQLGSPRTVENLQSFIQRKVETSVVVRNGSAIIIGGLIETRKKNDKKGIPGLQEAPIIGGLFSTEDSEDIRTELVLIIVPEVVDPEVDNRPLMQRFKQQMRAIDRLLNSEGVYIRELYDPETATPKIDVQPDAKIQNQLPPA